MRTDTRLEGARQFKVYTRLNNTVTVNIIISIITAWPRACSLSS